MAKRKVRVYIADPNVQMLQGGGGINQPQIEQEQLIQLIQAFAQATRQDPQMVMEQVASLQGEQLQQAIQQMTQVVQQGAPAQQGPPQQMAQQMPPQQMPPQAMSPEMAKDGGYIEEYAKKIKKLMSKKTGGITSSDTQKTVQKKNEAIIQNAIGKNFAENMIDNAGTRFMERASNPMQFAAGGGYDNPFLNSYNAAMDDAMMDQMQSDDLRRNRWADLTGSFHTYDQLKMKGVTPEGEKIKGKWNFYDNPYDAQGDFEPMVKRGGQLPMYQEEGEVTTGVNYKYNAANNTYEFVDKDGTVRVINAPIDKSTWEGIPDYNPYNVPLRDHLPFETRKRLSDNNNFLPTLQDGDEYDWQNSINYDNYPENAARVTLNGTADDGDVAVYTDQKKPGDPGYDAWVTSKVRGDWSNAFEGLQLRDIEQQYGMFGKPGTNWRGKEKKGRPRKTTFHFGYGDAPAGDPNAAVTNDAGATGGKAQWDYNSWDDLRGMLETDMDVSLNPNLTEGELFEMAKEQGLVGQAQQKQQEQTNVNTPATTADDERPSNIDRRGRLVQPSQRAIERRDRSYQKYMEREERRRNRMEDRAVRRFDDMRDGGMAPMYFDGGMIPMFEEGGFDPYLDMTMKEDKVGMDEGAATGWGMALASNLADRKKAAQIKENEATAYRADLNNPILPADVVGSRGSFADTTGAPTFQRDKHMGFTGGYWGADQPAQYPGGAYYGRDGGSMGGYDMNQDVYLNTDEIEFILKNGGKVEYL